MKVSRTVWSRGKDGDNIKVLPIAIISYFEKGVRIKGLTIAFALNRKYVDLAKELNKYMDITRPALNDARFMKDIEKLKLEGNYKGINTVNVNGNAISLKQYVSDWFKNEVDEIISQALNELDFNSSDIENLTPVHFGGGAKLLQEEIAQNKQLTKVLITEQAEYRNVLAYYEIASILKNWQ